MASAAKMDFFRIVVIKTACKESQEYFAVLNHLEIKMKKKLYSVSAQYSSRRKTTLAISTKQWAPN